MSTSEFSWNDAEIVDVYRVFNHFHQITNVIVE